MAVQYCNYDIKGTLAVASSATITGALNVTEYIFRTGQGSNYHRFLASRQIFVVGNASSIDLNNGVSTFGATGGATTLRGASVTLDSSADITLDADGGDILLKDGGTLVGTIGGFASNSVNIKNEVSNGDIRFQGNDGGSAITALTLDMSDAGAAEFGGRVYIPDYIAHTGDSNTLFGFSGANTYIVNTNGTTALTIDSSQNATFPGVVTVKGSGSGYEMLKITSSVAANVNKQAGITTENYVGSGTVSIMQYASSSSANTVYYGSADGAHSGLQNHRFYVNASPNTPGSGHTEALHIASNTNATFAGQVTGPTPTTTTSFANKAYVDAHVSPTGTYLPLAGGTMTGNTKHNDDVFSYWGNSDDLSIQHNNSGQFAQMKNYTGDLYFTNTADDKDIIFQADNSTNGTETYLTLDGSNRSIVVTAALGVYHNDGVASRFGDAGDLQIYHNGSNSFIDESGTGNLFIRSNMIQIRKYTGEDMITCLQDNAVTLYFDNSPKLATSNTGISVTGAGNFSGNVVVHEGVSGQITITTNNIISNQHLLLGTNGGANIEMYTNGQAYYDAVSHNFRDSDASPTYFSITASQVNSFVKLSVASNKIIDLATPTLSTDAANKSYVDAQIATIPSGLNFQGNWNASTNSPTLS